MRFDDHLDLILPLRRQGKSLSFILRELRKVDPFVSYYALRTYLSKFNGVSTPSRRVIHQPRVFADCIEVIKEEIHKCFSANSSITIREIQERLCNDHGINISETHLKRLRNSLGYSRTTTKYCQIISRENKEKRLSFCKEMLEKSEIFADCIFTDESIFQLNCSTKYCYVQRGSYRSRIRCRAKHPAKLHVWGGISMRGATSLAILPGNTRINSNVYCNILKRCYLPFASKIFHGYARLVHDNAPAHVSSQTTRQLQSWGVKVLAWPPESPDLNPIENVWGSMKKFIRSNTVRTIPELKTAIRNYWKSLSVTSCKNYIKGIRWRLQKVIEACGGHIKEERPVCW